MRWLTISALLLCPAWFAEANELPSPIADLKTLSEVLDRPGCEGQSFHIPEAIVSSPPSRLSDRFAVSDSTGSLSVTDGMFYPEPTLRAGDRLRMSGVIIKQDNGLYNYAKATNIAIIAHGPAPAVLSANAAEINAGKVLDRIVCMEGRVVDVLRDEIDPRFVFFVIADGSDFIYAHLHAEDSPAEHDRLYTLMDAVVRATGLCTRMRPQGFGRMLDITLALESAEAITIVAPPPADPFSAPLFNGRIHEIQHLPGRETFRRKVRGTVIAVWGKNTALVRMEDNALSTIGFASGTLPTCGDFIEAVGAPETDLFTFNLSRAIWRPADGKAAPAQQAESVPVRSLFVDKHGNAAINQSLHGHSLRFQGRVRTLPSTGDERMTLETDGYAISVDSSSCPDVLAGIEVGCTIVVTGICVMETENWRPQLAFPQIKRFFLAIRTVDDVRVLSRPSRLTPARLLLVIAALLAALAVFAVWNRILKRIVEQRSRELSREQVIRERSDMQKEERTRLAVELHDTIAQNLTGASFEINAAERLMPTDADGSLKHLGRAARTLKSCRDELRNCIWDLRNRALDAPDMNTAIRRTLEPHIADTSLSVRFNVPRTTFSDNSAHALMRIIRELTLNAIRHGGAKSVKIAGSVESGVLNFSVRDDGSGFDPDKCPGLREGHFGLQGVRERIKKFNGTMTIESNAQTGTRIAMTMALPSAGNGPI